MITSIRCLPSREAAEDGARCLKRRRRLPGRSRRRRHRPRSLLRRGRDRQEDLPRQDLLPDRKKTKDRQADLLPDRDSDPLRLRIRKNVSAYRPETRAEAICPEMNFVRQKKKLHEEPVPQHIPVLPVPERWRRRDPRRRSRLLPSRLRSVRHRSRERWKRREEWMQNRMLRKHRPVPLLSVRHRVRRYVRILRRHARLPVRHRLRMRHVLHRARRYVRVWVLPVRAWVLPVRVWEDSLPIAVMPEDRYRSGRESRRQMVRSRHGAALLRIPKTDRVVP